MQHLMAENQRLSEQMLKVMKQEDGPKVPDKSDTIPDVKRPLIGSFDRDRPRAGEGDEEQHEVKDIDKKDVALPVKYKGEVTQWRHWYMKFTSFLNRETRDGGSFSRRSARSPRIP